ncbi:MAG: hypothetical protein ETSY1_05520 [Candidatus Entotheonella factor]|uniref:NodB homology domain-containing protein n=1 Tax=Entotheonella factor TaxID=1429438 RepID=W4LVY3_ENTF1|nr:MAG: hypothetical protein ETSY1_05520 [Candidatus Entotheonella factor]
MKLNRETATFCVKWLLLRLGFFRLLRWWWPRRELAVLRYHAVCLPACTYASRGISVTPKGFERQVRYLAKHYAVMPLEEAVACLRSGELLPPNAVAITFDDGYHDNYTAFQILRAYGACATFFLTSNCIDDREVFWVSEVRHLILRTSQTVMRLDVPVKQVSEQAFDLRTAEEREAVVSQVTRLIKSCTIAEREVVLQALRTALADVDKPFDGPQLMLSSEQVQDMLEGGMSMGGHTLTHANLPSAGLADAQHELLQCRLHLQQRFGMGAMAMAYPNGGANAYVTPDIQRLAQETGYDSAWTSASGFVDETTDLFCGPRIGVSESLVQLVYDLEGERLRARLNAVVQAKG